jgi:hypothetical protein
VQSAALSVVPTGKLRAVFCKINSMSFGSKSGLWDSKRAAAAETSGVAKLVPIRAW